MPARTLVHARPLTTPERKQLLVLACAMDRLEFALRWRRSPSVAARAVRAMRGPWLAAAWPVLVPLLPRRLRCVAALVRAWLRAGARDAG